MADVAGNTSSNDSVRAGLLATQAKAQYYHARPDYGVVIGLGWQLFFQPVDLCCQLANFGVEFLEVLMMLSSLNYSIITPFKQRC